MRFDKSIDLVEFKEQMKAQIDTEAGNVRAAYITVAPGQEMVYMTKEAEAQLILADPGQGSNVPDTDTPHVSSEATHYNVTRFAKAQEILGMRAAWAAISPQIETRRLAAKDAVAAATTLAEARAAANVSWSDLFTAS